MKNNKGFSLVELVVVIAIMAILVGVAVPVYSAYVEKSKKAMDKDLVAGVMDAVKKGTYSQMFVNDDSFKMGSMSYPVGFIVLTKDGVRVVASETEVYPATTGKCVFETIENVVKETQKSNYYCLQHASASHTEVTTVTVQYCTTHSAQPKFESKDGQSYVSGFTHRGGALECMFGCNEWTANNTSYPSGSKKITNENSVYTVSPEPTLCEAAYANQYGTFGETKINDNVISGPLYDALVAAYGEGLADLKLSYDGWTSTEGVDYATFYTSADILMGDVERLTGLLVIGDGLAQLAGKDLGLSDHYNNSEEVLIGISKIIAESHTPDTWDTAWKKAATDPWDGCGFGISGSNRRDVYSAARMAYNNAFASYLQAYGINETYLKLIREFYVDEMFGVGLPGTVNKKAFTETDKLKNKFKEAGDTTAGEEGSIFNQCKDLFDQYVDSGAYVENGKLVYNTLVNFNDTAGIANAYVDQSAADDDIFDYYNIYVKEISELYKKAQTLSEDGIVIIVTVTDGELDFVVSPSEADPRKG